MALAIGDPVAPFALRDTEGAAARKSAMSLFGFSILYLFALFLTIVIENGPAQMLARALGSLAG